MSIHEPYPKRQFWPWESLDLKDEPIALDDTIGWIADTRRRHFNLTRSVEALEDRVRALAPAKPTTAGGGLRYRVEKEHRAEHHVFRFCIVDTFTKDIARKELSEGYAKAKAYDLNKDWMEQ